MSNTNNVSEQNVGDSASYGSMAAEQDRPPPRDDIEGHVAPDLGQDETGGVDDDAGAFADAVAEYDSPLSAEEKIASLEAELLEVKDKALRAMAESENIRKRSEKEKSQIRVYAIERFANDLLAVGDNLERAKSSLTPEMHADMGDAGQALAKGVDLTLRALQDTFARHGIKPIDAAPGAPFDPNIHQAVSQIPSDVTSGAIAMTFQPGWQIGERTLRAAMVAVSAGKPSPQTAPEPPQSDQDL